MLIPYEVDEITNYGSELGKHQGSYFVVLRTHELTLMASSQVGGFCSLFRQLRTRLTQDHDDVPYDRPEREEHTLRLLTATDATQGQHPGDFHCCIDGELVMPPAVICDPDEYADDPGTGGCGCGRSFTGLYSHRGTTTAAIRDLDIDPDEYAAAITDSLERQGWETDGGARTARHLAEIAAGCPVGMVLGHRLGELYVRHSPPAEP
jgi:hypothetical protein